MKAYKRKKILQDAATWRKIKHPKLVDKMINEVIAESNQRDADRAKAWQEKLRRESLDRLKTYNHDS